MPHPLDEPLLKLQRANEHIDALDRELKAWLHSKPKPIGITFEGHTEEAGNRFRFNFREPPRHAGLVFGDAITNMRAALDHLAWQLALNQCGDRAVPSRRTAYPIQNDPDDWPGAANDYLRHVPPAAWDLIEFLQPYHGWDWPELAWLRLVNDLANGDKHRVTHFVAGRVIVRNSQTKSTARIGHTLQDGDVLHLKVEPVDHNRKFEIAAEVGVEFEGQMCGVEGLRHITNFIRDDLIPCFHGFFDPRSMSDPPPVPTRAATKRGTRRRRSPKQR